MGGIDRGAGGASSGAAPVDLPPFEGKPVSLAALEHEFERHLRFFERFRPVGPETRILDLGCGSGWFPVLCRRGGLSCRGIEVRPHMVEYGRDLGRRLGVEGDIVLGDVQTMDLGDNAYDIVLATSVFEHLERWRRVLRGAYRALRPGGLLYFYSTNKFAPRSAECPALPFYGWLPDRWRYRLRVRREGEGILQWGGIDYNQFTHFELRAFLKSLGYARVLDDIDRLDPDHLGVPRLWKRAALRFLKRFAWLKDAALLFAVGTRFICIK